MMMTMRMLSVSVIVHRAADELRSEANARAVLNHVNVVSLYAMVFEPQHYGIVLEFVPRGCLEEFTHTYQVLFHFILVIFIALNSYMDS